MEYSVLTRGVRIYNADLLAVISRYMGFFMHKIFRIIATFALLLSAPHLTTAQSPDSGAGVEGVVDEEIQEQVEAEVGDVAEDEVEAATEEQLEEAVEDVVDSDLDDVAEEVVEGSVEETVEEGVEEAAEEVVEGSVEETVEEGVEEAAEEVVEASVEETVEEGVEEAAEEVVEASVEETVEEGVEEAAEEVAQLDLDDLVDEIALEALVDTTEERIVVDVEELVSELEGDLSVAEGHFHLGDWLLLATPEVFEELYAEGFIFDDVTELPALELRMGVATAPASFDIDATRAGIMEVVGSEEVKIDLNHIYTAGAQKGLPLEGSLDPASALPFPGLNSGQNFKIGMADSAIDVAHPVFRGASITVKSFVATAGKGEPNSHGTAIASILVGKSENLSGIARNSDLYAAGIFSEDSERGEFASALSVIKALDWLLSQDVSVINLSIAGPPNALMERALKKVGEAGVVVTAAAGNGGPSAAPAYPAAYPSVMAVTAIDARRRAYRLANRGDYVDIAAPGVNIRHAAPGGGYGASSGTSYAVPFVTLEAARLKLLRPSVDVLEELRAKAIDLGEPGFDEIYGYGLLQPK